MVLFPQWWFRAELTSYILLLPTLTELNKAFVDPGQAFDAAPVMLPVLRDCCRFMHLGALVEVPPHANAAVTQNCPGVNAAGNVISGLVPVR